jgi:hypothetical protein
MIDFDTRLRQGLRALAESDILDIPDVETHGGTTGGGGRWVRSVALAAAAALVLVGVVVVVRRTDRHTDPAHAAVSLVEVSSPPLSARASAAVVSTTHGLVVWGGRQLTASGITAGPAASSQFFGDGAELRSGDTTWRLLPPAPITARSNAFAVYDGGDRVTILGGWNATGNIPDGAVLHLDTGTWTRLARAPACATSADWNTQTLYVLTRCDPSMAVVTSLDPATGRWSELPPLPGDNAGGILTIEGRPVVWWPDGSYRSLSADRTSWSVRVPLLADSSRPPVGIIPVRRHGTTDLVVQFEGPEPKVVVASFAAFERVWRVDGTFELKDQAANDSVVQPTGFDDQVPYYSQLGIAWIDPRTGDQGTFPFTDTKWADVRLATAHGLDPAIVATEVSSGHSRLRLFRLQRR